ncbi:hypothetical protein [Clostridium sp. CF012]|uniref:hypothetical protein n=1 Tax=Clostridium sp. CF012 TaxID=2843319 RepID=UPI001C0D3656|nr:hypothetical protein [Clostridium sp. CF012]MBU3142240.1 hypothetical protein [Clostridium sp. CF012]
MSIKGLKRAPAVKDFKGMNILGNLVYHKEAIKREQDIKKREFHKRRLIELKIELENLKIVV